MYKSFFFQITKWFTTLKLVLLLQAPLLGLQWHTKIMKPTVETQGLNLKPKMATALGKNPPIPSNLSRGIDNCFGCCSICGTSLLEGPVQQRFTEKVVFVKK